MAALLLALLLPLLAAPVHGADNGRARTPPMVLCHPHHRAQLHYIYPAPGSGRSADALTDVLRVCVSVRRAGEIGTSLGVAQTKR
jgi:hypothetical protein